MKILVISFVLIVAIPSIAQTIDSSDEAAITDLVRGYGFCQGQKTSLDRIKTEFPDLKFEALRVELQFASKFGKACDFFEKVIPDQTKRSIFAKYEELTRDFAYTRPIVEAFLNLVEKRSKGDVESPFLESLLTWHPDFKERPELEFLRGYIRKYSTSNHPKAKGLNLDVSVPVSWKSREGNRPNVVQFFRSKNGFSNISFGVMVKEIPLPKGVKITQREVDQMFTPRGLRELVEGEGTLIESKPIVLEGLKGGFWIIDMLGERLDQKRMVRMAQFGIFYKNRFIFLQFSSGGDPTNRTDWIRDFEINKPLFYLIASSLVINDKYK